MIDDPTIMFVLVAISDGSGSGGLVVHSAMLSSRMVAARRLSGPVPGHPHLPNAW